VNGRAGAGSARVYTVKAGDTLSGIGAKLRVGWRAVMGENGIAAPTTIYPGQALAY